MQYLVIEGAIFAQNTLKPDEFHLFRQIFDIVTESVPKPDLYVFLYSNTQKLLENIKKRGRDYEQEISAGYLNKIGAGYLRYFKQITSFPVLILDVNQIDFVENPGDYSIIKEVIFKSGYKSGINRLILP